jgi:hypothetical protein
LLHGCPVNFAGERLDSESDLQLPLLKIEQG